jgi:hypothetical protein
VRFAPNRAWLALAGLAIGTAAAAQEEVPLDRLLKLPDAHGGVGGVETRAGSTRAEWLARFEQARQEVETAQASLEATRSQIEEKAGEESAWRMGAPGVAASGSAADAPLDYKLTQELRRNREEVDRAERQLQDLEVEANLAGVPEEWRGPAAAPTAAPGAAPR